MKIRELQDKIKAENYDSFLAIQNAHYLSETTTASAVIVSEDKSTLICNRMELDRAKRESVISDIRPFSETKTPLREDEKVFFGEINKLIGEELKRGEFEKIAFDQLESKSLEKIRELYHAKYEKNLDLIWNLRKIKTSKELEKIGRAGKVTSKVMEKAAEIIEPGLSELEITAELEHEMKRLGSEGTAFDTIVASGQNSWLPHYETSDKKLEKGELVVIDLGAEWRKYKSDMSRTFTLSPIRKQEKLMDIVKKSQAKALKLVKAGVKGKEVDEAAREVFRKFNYERFYLHGLGHGVGIDIHEPPRLNSNSDVKLKAGMVITIEPGIYIKDIGGCRFEDTIVVQENGYEKITK